MCKFLCVSMRVCVFASVYGVCMYVFKGGCLCLFLFARAFVCLRLCVSMFVCAHL